MSLESPVLAGSLPLVPPGTNVQLASEETHELSLWVTLTSEYTFHVWMRKAKEVLKNTLSFHQVEPLKIPFPGQNES